MPLLLRRSYARRRLYAPRRYLRRAYARSYRRYRRY